MLVTCFTRPAMRKIPVTVYDLETVPDLGAVARIHGLEGRPEAEVLAALGDGFPKPMLHSIACIGALNAAFVDGHWQVTSLGAPHVGQRSEGELIAGFIGMINKDTPTLVSFNGSGFDLPVLRYRAMVHGVAAPGLLRRNYFYRFGDSSVDLCDVLSSYGASTKVKLDELARTLGIPGKPDGMEGSQVAKHVREGRIAEVAAYCESDVVITYRIWLRHEVFRGELSPEAMAQSEAHLEALLERRRTRA
jgi:predicted PolB exonuclease-like 3'-5' exonuclease